MNSVTDVISMSGYGLYVWTAYGLGCFLLVGNLYWNKIKRIKIKKALRQHSKRIKS